MTLRQARQGRAAISKMRIYLVLSHLAWQQLAKLNICVAPKQASRGRPAFEGTERSGEVMHRAAASSVSAGEEIGDISTQKWREFMCGPPAH